MHPGEADSYKGRPLVLSWPSSKTARKTQSLRLYGLFGGKKDSNGKNDDGTSKVHPLYYPNMV